MASQQHTDNDNEIVSDINMTPFIDIMLVILIIFMVSSSVGLETGLDIEVPKSSKSEASKGDPKAVVVSLDDQGKLFVENQSVSEVEFIKQVKISMDKKQTALVIFQGDKSSSLGTTVKVMEWIKKAGAKNIGIATQSN